MKNVLGSPAAGALGLVAMLWLLAVAAHGQDSLELPPAASEPAAESSELASGDSPPASEPAPAAEPSIGERLHLGVDVSGHSGEVDWVEVAAAGHTYAFVKATEGVDLKDPAFDEHWEALKKAGLVRGAYHFYVTEDDPEEQARFFIETVALEPGDLAPVVDIELIGHGTEPGLPGRLQRFLVLLEQHYGVRPIIYTSPDFWDQHLTPDFGHYPLWVAEYGVTEPRLPQGWDHWHLWQWQGDATIPGVEHTADRSHLNREAPSLERLVVTSAADD